MIKRLTILLCCLLLASTVGGSSSTISVPINSSGSEFSQDTTTGSFTTISYAHHEIHEGSMFFIKNYVDIAGSSTVDFLAITPDTEKWAHMLVNFDFEAEAHVTIYEGSVVSSNGTPIASYNRNRNSAITPTTVMYSAPSMGTLGAEIASYKTGSGKKIGGEARAVGELILDQDSNYLIRIVNDTETANWCNYLADWYEHTNR